ncbi:hypothetical protein EMIT079MI2_10323 [Bacillus sp. IT-79MI2]|nr:hypothetical protein BTH41_00333 [Bacillus mycoides]
MREFLLLMKIKDYYTFDFPTFSLYDYQVVLAALLTIVKIL